MVATIGEVRVQRLHLVENIKLHRDPEVSAIARFDCDIGCIKIFGITLMRRGTDDYFLAMPKRNYRDDKKPAVLINNSSLRQQVLDAASAAYQAI